MRAIHFGCLLLVISSCNGSLVTSEDINRGLEGSWMLYEEGYSPGSGYIVNPVSDTPPQVLQFLDKHALVSSVNGLQQYRFFIAEYDNNNVPFKIKLLQDDPSSAKVDRAVEFYVEMAGDKLKLMQVGCIEGCHMGFVKKTLFPSEQP